MSAYLEVRRYRGSDGAVVELDAEHQPHGHPRYVWWWRIEGTEQWYGGRGLSKINALIEAAAARGMSAAAWDPQPVEELEK